MPMSGERKREYDRQRYHRKKEEKANEQTRKPMTKPIHVSIGDNLDDPDLLKAIDENIKTRADERSERIYDIKVRLVDSLIAKGLSIKEATILANEKSRGKFWNMSLEKLNLYLYGREEYEIQHLQALRADGHVI